MQHELSRAKIFFFLMPKRFFLRPKSAHTPTSSHNIYTYIYIHFFREEEKNYHITNTTIARARADTFFRGRAFKEKTTRFVLAFSRSLSL